MDAIAFLARKSKTVGPFYVVAGDEAFLRRLAVKKLRDLALGDDPDESAVATYSGESAAFSDVWDELQTLPLFAPRRIVVVEGAEPFVSANRGYLEKKVEAKSFPESGLLILDVKSWPANTRLAKMVDSDATIVCKSPPAYKLASWACEWAASQHQKSMSVAAGQLLVELVGDEMGLLDQEILKLATYVGERATIKPEDVDKLVGNSRGENIWKILDLVGQGQAGPALRILQRLLEQGEEPERIVGALASQLRKLAAATRISAIRPGSVSSALAEAGVVPFGLKSAEAQLRHLTRARASKLYDRLLELQLDFRGNSPLPKNLLLERFLLRLAVK